MLFTSKPPPLNRLPVSLAVSILLLLAQVSFSFLCHVSYMRLQIKSVPTLPSPCCVLCAVSALTNISISYLITVDRILLQLMYTACFCFVSIEKRECTNKICSAWKLHGPVQMAPPASVWGWEIVGERQSQRPECPPDSCVPGSVSFYHFLRWKCFFLCASLRQVLHLQNEAVLIEKSAPSPQSKHVCECKKSVNRCFTGQETWPADQQRDAQPH